MPRKTERPRFLTRSGFKLVFFGGKGGVGKTTMAAATAISLAQDPAPGSILLLSTDPAHSLSDSLGQPVGEQNTRIMLEGGAILHARQMNAAALLDQFKEKYTGIIRRIAERGTYFDHEDIGGFLELSLPGLDEVMAVLEISYLIKGEAFDTVVVDTAPTGHTVRMLELPRQMARWINIMDLMMAKHRYLFKSISGRPYVKDECDRFLDRFSRDLKLVNRLLRDKDQTCFVPVTLPEPMVINETSDLIRALARNGIHAGHIIVNRVMMPAACPFCAAQERVQAEYLQRIGAEFRDHPLIFAPLFSRQISGMEGLYNVGACLTGDENKGGRFPPAHAELSRSAKPMETTEAGHQAVAVHFPAHTRIILTGGKGGVGKTTIAASIGLNLSHAWEEKKILVFSTDPAHSLSDALEMPVGNTITPVTANLDALEIDASSLFNDFKRRFQEDIQQVFNRFLEKNMDIKFDREVMTKLMSLAPPGLDEIMALDAIMDLVEKNAYDTIVIDSSPTGHLLRFLELPELIRQWLNAFFKVLIKYKGTIRLHRFAQKAITLSRGVKNIKKMLADSDSTCFVGVTIPEKMGFLESKDLIHSVEHAGIPCACLVINMVIPENRDCMFCREKFREQQEIVQMTASQFHWIKCLAVEKRPLGIRGIDHLKSLISYRG